MRSAVTLADLLALPLDLRYLKLEWVSMRRLTFFNLKFWPRVKDLGGTALHSTQGRE